MLWKHPRSRDRSTTKQHPHPHPSTCVVKRQNRKIEWLNLGSRRQLSWHRGTRESSSCRSDLISGTKELQAQVDETHRERESYITSSQPCATTVSRKTSCQCGHRMGILTAQIHTHVTADGCPDHRQKTFALPLQEDLRYSAHPCSRLQQKIQWSGRFLEIFGLTQQASVCLVRWSYPLRLQRTGPEARASPQTADSSPASPPPRLATCSLNLSPLLRGPSCAPSIHRPRLLTRRGDPSAQSSHRQPYPVDKLLKFAS